MIRFLSFSSGSCGNCYLLLGEEGGVLIDAGVSLRRMKKILEGEGLDFNCFQSVLVTHDHGDHIRNLGSICKRLSRPVWTTPTLHEALLRHPFTHLEMGGCRRDLPPGEWKEVARGIEARCFIVPHDATQTVGYAIRLEGGLFVLMTDLGHVTDEAIGWASEADTVIVESNYDVDMLLGGNYPHVLKMRICQGAGHLSNEGCCEAIRRFMHPGLKNLFLCHLSGNNNTPALAYDAASATLRDLGVPEGSVHLRVLQRGLPSPLLNL